MIVNDYSKIINIFSKKLSFILSPAIITPLASFMLIIPANYLKDYIGLILTIIVTIVGIFIEIKDETVDDFKFNNIYLREKRYTLLAIGVLYFLLLFELNLNMRIIHWSLSTFYLLSLFLSITILFKVKLSAHILFLYIVFGGFSFVINKNYLIFPLILLTILLGGSRINLKKHNLIQILITIIICTLYFYLLN